MRKMAPTATCVVAFIFLLSGLSVCLVDGVRKSTGAPPPDEDSDSQVPRTEWLSQRLDHFNFQDQRMWHQRYFVNDDYYMEGGPVFIFVSGEEPANIGWSTDGQWMEWAKYFNAICFQLEHRFYGKSHPTFDVSLKSLMYLNTDQALADVAIFRNAMAEKYGLQDSKWILFGGAYAGSLVARFRVKYPHLSDGAVASSAIINNHLSYSDYYRIVTVAMNEEEPNCAPAVRAAISQIDGLLATGEEGRKAITHKFQLCSELDTDNQQEVYRLFNVLSSNFLDAVQFNSNNQSFLGISPTKMTLKRSCGIMVNDSIGPEIDRYALINALIMNEDEDNCTNADYETAMAELKITGWRHSLAPSGLRQWFYQKCSELGLFQTTDNSFQTFGNKAPIEYYVTACQDVFGSRFNVESLEAAINDTNTLFGGVDMKVSKVVFVNGDADPWYLAGVTKSANDEAPAILIKGASHCADMEPSCPSDPPQLTTARKSIRDLIMKWIS